VAAYRAGLKLAPERTTMRRRLAEVLVELREFDEAGELLERCAREDPQDPRVAIARANCLFVQGEVDRAREVLGRQASAPPDFEAQRLSGEIELAQGRFQQALEHLEKAARQRPNDATVRNALGRTLRALGRADEAQAHFDYVAQAEASLSRMERQLRLAVERPDDAGLRYEIGTTLLQYGSPEDGAKWLRTVLELDPNHRGAHQALAAYHQACGNWDRAGYHLRQSGGWGNE
jgi:tetratricopeptide (TPR) repeat protein